MDFSFSEEHRMIQKSAREFAIREIAPMIPELDAKETHDPSLPAKMGQNGFLGLCIPKKYGGSGFDYLSLGLACQEFEKIDTSARVILSVHLGLNSLALLQWGNEEQKKRYLIPQAKGEKIATFALTEPNAGSDVAGIQTTAKRSGKNYLLNGEKMWISLADVADHFLIFAYTDHSKGDKGISAFIVERGFKGVSTGTIHGKLGVRAGNTGFVSLSDVVVGEENRLGEEGEGFSIAMSALDNGRYTVAAGAVGLMEACLEASVKYAKERMAFGKSIAEHQLVKKMIAEISADIEIGKLLYYRAGWLKNQGKRNTRETSLAKLTNCTNAFQAAHNALQIHGAYGYSREFPVERYFRNARGAMIYEGTREIHELIQADYALGLRADKPLRAELPIP
ncbi:MAG: acyl-CoA dehydrogenase family protein [Candidatus Omnitrophica bacterium]|nr:acyl-CoA dehydrogenase family protein [Candidatus Omnitrophota bacterium]